VAVEPPLVGRSESVWASRGEAGPNRPLRPAPVCRYDVDSESISRSGTTGSAMSFGCLRADTMLGSAPRDIRQPAEIRAPQGERGAGRRLRARRCWPRYAPEAAPAKTRDLSARVGHSSTSSVESSTTYKEVRNACLAGCLPTSVSRPMSRSHRSARAAANPGGCELSGKWR
jgi:hypothetical protein